MKGLLKMRNPLEAVARKHLLPLGSEDVFNPEELEELEEEAWEAALRDNELFTGEEITETEEPSPDSLKDRELEPKKEKPEHKDSTNSHELETKSHDYRATRI